MTKLKNFLKKHEACEDGYLFAKDLTLEEFLNTCPRGDWILWLFARTNPDSLKELTLAKGHCANTVRYLMKDEESVKAVDVAIDFGEGRATRCELDDASSAAAYAASYASSSVAYAAAYAVYAASSASASVDAVFYAKKSNQQQTADICRKYLPLSIWNEEVLND